MEPKDYVTLTVSSLAFATSVIAFIYAKTKRDRSIRYDRVTLTAMWTPDAINYAKMMNVVLFPVIASVGYLLWWLSNHL